MKLLATFLILLLNYTVSAQTNDLIEYQVDILEPIESLRISVKGDINNADNSDVIIQSICASTVYLQLNPALDYELFVNEDQVIEVTSADIIARHENENNQISFEENESWLATQSSVLMTLDPK